MIKLAKLATIAHRSNGDECYRCASVTRPAAASASAWAFAWLPFFRRHLARQTNSGMDRGERPKRKLCRGTSELRSILKFAFARSAFSNARIALGSGRYRLGAPGISRSWGGRRGAESQWSHCDVIRRPNHRRSRREQSRICLMASLPSKLPIHEFGEPTPNITRFCGARIWSVWSWR